MINAFSFALLLTALYVLRFRGWKRPLSVLAYLVFFVVLEVVASRYFLPPGAFGSGLAWVCFGLTLPVVVVTILVWRHERDHGVAD